MNQQLNASNQDVALPRSTLRLLVSPFFFFLFQCDFCFNENEYCFWEQRIRRWPVNPNSSLSRRRSGTTKDYDDAQIKTTKKNLYFLKESYFNKSKSTDIYKTVDNFSTWFFFFRKYSTIKVDLFLECYLQFSFFCCFYWFFFQNVTTFFSPFTSRSKKLNERLYKRNEKDMKDSEFKIKQKKQRSDSRTVLTAWRGLTQLAKLLTLQEVLPV